MPKGKWDMGVIRNWTARKETRPTKFRGPVARYRVLLSMVTARCDPVSGTFMGLSAKPVSQAFSRRGVPGSVYQSTWDKHHPE